MLAFVDNGVMTIKFGNQTTGNACVIRSYESSFQLLPISGKVTFGENPRKPTIQNACFQQ
jgi:hypothetical protein